MERVFFAFFAFFVFIFLASILSGCIQRAPAEIEYIKPAEIKVTPEKVEAFLYPCMTFECENKSMGIFGWRRLAGEFPSLYEGSCKFVQYNMTMADLKKLNDTLAGRKGNWRIRTFMIGQGPNLATANEMQKYCNWSLAFGVHWLTKPEISTELRSAINCSLRNNTIPYIIIRTGQQIGLVLPGPAPIVSISKGLDGLGPIFISPEGELGEDVRWLYEPFASDYVYQVGGIAANCKSCIIAPLVKFNDTRALSFLSERELGGKFLINYTELISYGINLSKFDCNKYSVVDGIRNFTAEIMRQYRKPSLIAYIVAKPGPNEGGTCTWTEDEIAATYEYLYSQIPFLVPNGLIGMALHDATSGFDKFGVQKPSFKAWFANCQAYVNQTAPELSPQVPLLFPLGGDVEVSNCTRLNTAAMMLYLKCGVNYSLVPPIEEDVEIKEKLVLCGDICFTFGAPYDIKPIPACEQYAPAIKKFLPMARECAATNAFDFTILWAVSLQTKPPFVDAEQFCSAASMLASYYYSSEISAYVGEVNGVPLRIYLTLCSYKEGKSCVPFYEYWKGLRPEERPELWHMRWVKSVLTEAVRFREACKVCK